MPGGAAICKDEERDVGAFQLHGRHHFTQVRRDSYLPTVSDMIYYISKCRAQNLWQFLLGPPLLDLHSALHGLDRQRKHFDVERVA